MTQIGTVKSITGVAQAVAEDGTTRVLVLGDPIYEGETINTIGVGSNVDLSFNSGRDLVLSGDEKALIDQSVYAKEGFDNTDVTAAQQAILDGGNLPAGATAAGQQGPNGAGGFTQAYDAIRGDARGDVSTHNLGTDGFGSGVPLAFQEGLINEAPTAVDDKGVAVEEGSGGEGQYDAGVVATGNVLANDIDDGLPNPAGDLDVTNIVSTNTTNATILGTDGNYTITGEYGTLVLNAETGEYTYTVDDANPVVNAQNIGDTLNENFTYTVSDGSLSDTANLSITINGANDAPIAVDDRTGLTVVQGEIVPRVIDSGDGVDYVGVQEVSVDAWSFTHNGGPLTIDVLTERGDGTHWTDIDNDGFQSNLDSMIHVYSVDSHGNRTPTYLASNDDGAFGNDGSTHPWDSYLNLGNLPAGNYVIEISDYFFDTSEIGQAYQDASALGVNPGAYQITFDGNVQVTSVPELGKIVNAGNGGVGNNAVEANETDAAIPALGNVLDNDTDVDNAHDQLSVTNVDGTVVATTGNTTIDGLYGTLTMHPDGSFSYSAHDSNPTVDGLNIGESLTDTFTYTVSDNEEFGAKTDTANLTITIDGTNDAPVITSDAQHGYIVEDGTEDGTIVRTAEESQESTSGIIAFHDVDINDSHTVSYEFKSATYDSNIASPVSTHNIGLFTATQDGTNHQPGSIDWNFSVPNSDIQYLAAGETVDLVYTVTVTDAHGKTDAQDVTITVTGTNDTPIITLTEGTDTTGAVTEDATDPTLTDTGMFTFSDVDLTDTHTVSVANTSTGALGTLTAIVAEDSSSDHGAVNWTYTVDDAAVQYLGAGETKVETFDVTVDDGHGGTITQSVDVTITGTNDAPIISTGDTDMTFVSESAGYNNVLGVYTFDESGNPTNPHIVITGTNDADNLGVSHELGLPMGSFGLFLISNGETAYPSISTASISFDLSGTIPVLLIDGASSSKPVYFDNNSWNPQGHDHFDTTTNPDGSLTVAIEDLNMGDNDRMDLVVNLHAIDGSVGGTVVEIADGAPGENTTDISTSGILNFSDVDLIDTHTVTATANGTGYMGTFTSSIATAATGGAEGEINWSFSVLDSVVDHMGADESIVQTYTVTVNDGQGGTDTQEIAITIQGTNDRPIAFADHGTTSENAPLTIDVLANDTDADTNDTLSIHSFDTTTSGGGTISLVEDKLVFDPGHDFDYLGVEQSVDVTFSYQAQDDSLYMTPGSVTANHGISDPTTVTITVTGTNDAPIAHADYNLAAVDTNYYQADFNPDNLDNRITESAAAKVLISAEAGDSLSFDWSFDQKGWLGFLPADVAYAIVDNHITKLVQGHDKSDTFTLNNLSAGEHVISVVVSDRFNKLYDSTLDVTHFTTTATVLETTYADGSKIAAITDGIRLTAGDVSRSHLNAFLETHETLPYAYPTQGNVLNNDTDIDNNHAALSVISVNGHPIPSDGLITTSEGVLHINSDGSYEYTPNVEGSTSIISFNYEVSDGNGGTDTSTLYIATPYVDSVIMGDSGDNTLFGTDNSDAIFGGDGDDIIDGGKGNDYISAGDGDDIIHGGLGTDYILAGDGDDTIVHDTNDIFVDGGSGTDTLIVKIDTLDLSNVHNIEVVQLNNSANLGDNTHQLTAQDVFDMTSADISGNHELTITGVAGSDVTINTNNTSGDATFTQDTSSTSTTVDVYAATLADGTTVTLNIEQDLTVIT